jgi:hypothetical protein
MVADDGASGVDTSATAATYRKLHLDFTQAARALVDRAADLAIGDSVTDTHVHGLNPKPCRNLPASMTEA